MTSIVNKPRLIAAVVLMLAAAACHKQPDKQGQAGGEILPGSASDAMLPMDTVTSQPPLAPRSDKGPSAGESDAADAAAPDAAAPAAPASPAAPQG